jgi:uncharacterized protein (UPF0332 family)
MPVNANDFLDIASDALSLNTEIGFRNAISRSYYSMFHRAKSSLRNHPQDIRSAHQKLIDYLLSPEAARMEGVDAVVLRQMASCLHQRRELRVLADYNLNCVITKDTAKEGINMATLFFKYCESIYQNKNANGD